MQHTMSTKENGDAGELEVIEHVPCPNCGKSLMLLPPSFPMNDVQCIGCNFRAQIKTSNSKPKSIIFGSTWNITEKVLKAGYIMPPLFINFKWAEKDTQRQEIRFYPFIPKKNLRQRTLPESAKRAGLKMFDYIGLDKLPYFTLYTR
jgi:Dam-replacing family protein